jgi:hypothetical protein
MVLRAVLGVLLVLYIIDVVGRGIMLKINNYPRAVWRRTDEISMWVNLAMVVMLGYAITQLR